MAPVRRPAVGGGRQDGTVSETIGTPGGTPEKPAVFFADAAEFGRWLAAHHDTATELWMGLYKKASGRGGITWAEAVREALCWGWIDSRSERIDDEARRQRWTPRKPSSTWSHGQPRRRRRAHRPGADAAERPRGLRTAPPRPLRHLRLRDPHARAAARLRPASSPTNPAAAAFWEVATPGYRKLVVNWVLTAKQEKTRDARMAQLVADCAAGLLVKPQRYGTPPTWVARAAAAAREARGS